MSRHKHINTNDRRNFLRKMIGAGCAALSLTPFLSTLTTLGAINASASASRPIYSVANPSDYKALVALVCIMLSGGNDSFNMLVPSGDNGGSSGQGEYKEYIEKRGNMKLEQEDPDSDDLTDRILNPLSNDHLERQFSVHPSMPKIQALFNGTSENNYQDRHLSFIANVGTLLKKEYTLSDYQKNEYRPYNLFSHSDQIKSWHTGLPQGFGTTGWGGRIADILKGNNTNKRISMNIALDGTNVFQQGTMVNEYIVNRTGGGSIKLYHSNGDNSSFYDSLKLATTDSIMSNHYQNILEQAAANQIFNAKDKSNDFYNTITDTTFTTDYFPNSRLGEQLEMVAKTIKANTENTPLNGFTNQIFMVTLGGFDNHNLLLKNHSANMKELDDALYSFYRALGEIGLLNQVTTFTMSDFARTLRSNGDGTDHAWGGHHFVMGGAVDGGKIFGKYPDLANNNLDIGGGRFIPEVSCDEYFADLALWFGDNGTGANGYSSLTYQKLKDILPNIESFIPEMLNQVANTDRLGLFV